MSLVWKQYKVYTLEMENGNSIWTYKLVLVACINRCIHYNTK